jgi:hypothetical protein
MGSYDGTRRMGRSMMTSMIETNRWPPEKAGDEATYNGARSRVPRAALAAHGRYTPSLPLQLPPPWEAWTARPVA